MQSQMSSPAWYGASAGMVGGGATASHGIFKRVHRQRMNIVPILICLFVPWGIFCLVSYVLSFSLRYQQPQYSYAIVAAAALATAVIGVKAFEQGFRRGRDVERTPSWIIFCFLAMLLALVSGFIVGNTNYSQNTRKYYDVGNLMHYTAVFPNRLRGQQMMDAGIVSFANGSHIDVSKSMGFRNMGVYCVAPIVFGNESMNTYDFWAVGRDCCSGSQADFHCPGFNTPLATGGLRLMDEDERPYYRLAVQQAEATYDLRAVHPLFFEWVLDAPATVDEWLASGEHYFLVAICSHFVLQLFLVTVAAFGFSQIGDLS